MLIAFAIFGLLAVILAVSTVMYRQARVKDDPVLLWHHLFTSGAEAAALLAGACGLAREPRSVKWTWLTDFLLAPIYVFWGPMTSMSPERSMARWRLVGSTPSGRSVRIEMPAGSANFSAACGAAASFHASASRDGARWPIDEQEGARLLHPVGSARWNDGTALIEAAFALGLDHLRLSNGFLFADVDLGESGPPPEAYPGLLAAFDSIALWIESETSRPAQHAFNRLGGRGSDSSSHSDHLLRM